MKIKVIVWITVVIVSVNLDSIAWAEVPRALEFDTAELNQIKLGMSHKQVERVLNDELLLKQGGAGLDYISTGAVRERVQPSSTSTKYATIEFDKTKRVVTIMGAVRKPTSEEAAKSILSQIGTVSLLTEQSPLFISHPTFKADQYFVCVKAGVSITLLVYMMPTVEYVWKLRSHNTKEKICNRKNINGVKGKNGV